MKSIITFSILILVISFQLKAQEIISLERAREMALEQNQNIKIANKNLEKAQFEKKAMQTLYLPRLKGSATVAYLEGDFEQDIEFPIMGMPMSLPIDMSFKGAYLAGVNIEQPVFTGLKILTANKMAELGLEMAAQNIELKKINTIAKADQSYWLYVSVREKVKLAKVAVVMLDSLVVRVNNSVESGLVHRNELLKVKVKYNKATLDLQKAKSGLELTRMSLCQVLGLSFDTPIELADTLIKCSNNLITNFGDEDVMQRPEYLLMSQQIVMEEEQIKMSRSDFLPTIGLSAGYSYLGGIEIANNNISQNGFNVIGSIQIPIFHWGEGVQKIHSSTLSKEIKELELDRNTQLLQLEIEQSKYNLQDAYLRIKMAEKALDQSDENLRLSKNNYELGAELITDLLIAQAQWQQTYSNLIEAKADFKVKESHYLRAVGKLGR